MTGVVRLSWPRGPLWPNRRPHWSVEAKHRKAQNTEAWALTMQAGVRGRARLSFAFHPPRKPGMTNCDNLIAALKGSVDGIARALGVDDSELAIVWPEAFSEPVKGGLVVVTITPDSRAAE